MPKDYSPYLLEAHALLKQMSEAASRRQYGKAIECALNLGHVAITLLGIFRTMENKE